MMDRAMHGQMHGELPVQTPALSPAKGLDPTRYEYDARSARTLPGFHPASLRRQAVLSLCPPFRRRSMGYKGAVRPQHMRVPIHVTLLLGAPRPCPCPCYSCAFEK